MLLKATKSRVRDCFQAQKLSFHLSILRTLLEVLVAMRVVVAEARRLSTIMLLWTKATMLQASLEWPRLWQALQRPWRK